MTLGTDLMPSTEISQWRSYISENITKVYVMIVFDVEVCGGSIYDSELLLRKEPFRGCMSTMEAVARALGVLEPDGPEIEGTPVGVLKASVAGFSFEAYEPKA
ncbi:hypothetical protein V2J09_015993 [Rumex salicifolius]